jgi:hypothetical protein
VRRSLWPCGTAFVNDSEIEFGVPRQFCADLE